MTNDRNSLFGTLALRNGLVRPEDLADAQAAVARHPERPIGAMFVERGVLDIEQRRAIDWIVDILVRKHHGDAESSLAALTASPANFDTARLTIGRAAGETLEHIDSDHGPAAALGLTAGVASSPAAPLSSERYMPISLLDSGGLGEVFVALDHELNREVALKQIQERFADDELSRQRFVLEAEITGALEHPGVVPVYGLGSDAGGRPYYAMRLIRGETFQRAIDRFHADATLRVDLGRHQLELCKLLRGFLDICNVLEYAHNRGVLHRDIKPSNVVVGSHGETIVLDWGLAKLKGREPGSMEAAERPIMPRSASGGSQSLQGQAMGTPGFMSPEQAAGDLDAIGRPSDVYNLGATLYYLIAGRAPHPSREIGAMLDEIRRGNFPPPRHHNRSVDRGLEAITLKAMATDPADRYPTARAVAGDVERWLADEPISARRSSVSERARRLVRRNRVAFFAGGVMLLLAVAALGVGNVVLGRANKAIDAERARAVANADRAERNYQMAREAIDRAYIRIGRDRLRDEPGLERLRAELLAAPLEFYRRFVAERGDDPTAREDLARALTYLGSMESSLGERDRALADLQRACDLLADAESRSRKLADRNRIRAGRVDAHTSFASALEFVGRRRDGLAQRLLARDAARAMLRDDPGDSYSFRRTLAAESTLARSYYNMNQPDAAEALALKTLAELAVDRGRRADLEAPNEDEADLHGTLGMLCRLRQRLEESVDQFNTQVQIYAKLLESEPSNIHSRYNRASGLNNLAISLRRLKRKLEAERAIDEALALFQGLARDFPAYPSYRAEAATALGNLSVLVKDRGAKDEADRLTRQAVETLEGVVAAAPEVPKYAISLGALEGNVAYNLAERGDDTQAIAWFERSIERLTPLDESAPSDQIAQFLRNAYWGRAESLARLGRHAEADESFVRAKERATADVAEEVAAQRALHHARHLDPRTAITLAEEVFQAPSLEAVVALDALESLVVAAGRVGDPSVLDRAAEALRSHASEKLRASAKVVGQILREPRWQTLRDHPGVVEMLADQGFPADPFAP